MIISISNSHVLAQTFGESKADVLREGSHCQPPGIQLKRSIAMDYAQCVEHVQGSVLSPPLL